LLVLDQTKTELLCLNIFKRGIELCVAGREVNW